MRCVVCCGVVVVCVCMCGVMCEDVIMPYVSSQPQSAQSAVSAVSSQQSGVSRQQYWQ